MAGDIRNLFRPIAPGLSGAINPLAFIGAGMASGNPGQSLAQMAQIQQAGQNLALVQSQNQERLDLMRQKAEREAKERATLMGLAPGVAQEMFPGQPNVAAFMGKSPAMLGPAITARMRAGEPTSGMRQFSAFQGMPPEQQQQFLDYQRSMSPFAGAASFMSPLGAAAEKWKNEAGDTPSPALTQEQATQAGFMPTAKPTEKQQDVAAFVQNAEAAEKMLGGLKGWTAGGTLSARNPVSRLITSEVDKRASDLQLAWTMAVLRAESGAVISPSEAAQQVQVFFEQPGDTAQQKADKKALRGVKMQSMKQRAGKAYSTLPEPPAPQQAAPAAAQIPSTGDSKVDALMQKYLGP